MSNRLSLNMEIDHVLQGLMFNVGNNLLVKKYKYYVIEVYKNNLLTGEDIFTYIEVHPTTDINRVFAEFKNLQSSGYLVDIVNSEFPEPINTMLKEQDFKNPDLLENIILVQYGVNPEAINAFYTAFGYFKVDQFLRSCYGKYGNYFKFINSFMEEGGLLAHISSHGFKVETNKRILNTLVQYYKDTFVMENGWVFQKTQTRY